MIIQKIEIYNFRSYYKSNPFEFTKGLNLIIGSNGDGKTTFYEALEWLFRTDNTNKMDDKFISKKRIEELAPDESDDVKVTMTYEHKGSIKILEKMFHFTKSFDGDVTTSNYSFTLTETNGVEREMINGIYFDYDFPSELRQYTMFKGEGDLNVFQNSTALKMLVDTFSDVKGFDAYFAFLEYATKKADQARDNAQKNDKKNQIRINELHSAIETAKNNISDINKIIKNKESEVSNFSDLLRDLEHNKEASEILKSTNRRIETLQNKKAEIQARINENYTIKLLDNTWILVGFEKIAEEYSNKVSKIDRIRRKLEKDYYLEVGADKLLKKLQTAQTDFVPLPVHIPGPKIMQEMLDQEVCKICGRPAKMHSEAWEFMQQRLEEYKASLKINDNTSVKPYYCNKYIVELQKRDTILNDNLADITGLRKKIQDTIEYNIARRDDVSKIETNLSQEEENKKRILAQADGLTEDQLLSAYESISAWYSGKSDAERIISEKKQKLVENEHALEYANSELSKIAKGTSAELYAKTAEIIRNISEAFKFAKEDNKNRLLHAIEDESNRFMEKLNTNDFKGTIRIIEKANGQAESILVNNDDSRISHPNTALRTTYLMSILFALGKLSSEKDNTEFPLLFDAPTSSFTDAKESEFFNVISTLDKQVIIVTKSFLKENSKGEIAIDHNKIANVSGRVFRIEKKKPFDDKKLGTIQTVISKIK